MGEKIIVYANAVWHRHKRTNHTTEWKINRKVTRVGTFEVYVPTHVALRMLIMQVLASQLHFLANRNVGLAIPPLFWPLTHKK